MRQVRLSLVVGAGITGLGILVYLAPGLLAVGVQELEITIVATLVLVLALWLGVSRYRTTVDRPRLPDREHLLSVTPPGEELRSTLRLFRDHSAAVGEVRPRQGLERAAVAVLTRYESLPPEEVRQRVDDGSWTDDGEVVRFMNHEPPSLLSLVPDARTILRSGSVYRRNIHRSVEAIADVAGLSSEPEGIWKESTASTSDTGSDRPTQHDPRQDGGTGLRDSRQVQQWYGISAVLLVSLGAGILFEEPGVVLLGVIGLCYGVYARSHELSLGTLSLERELGEAESAPGDEVEVTVRLTNEGTELLPDVRVVDGAPGTLSVADGSPRVATALRPGETVEWRYTVTARRGVHEFDPAFGVIQNLPGTVAHEYDLVPEESTALSCTPQMRELPVSMPLREATTLYTGVQPTTTSGDGLEFFATRQYHHGDDMSRINWNQLAKAGELSTLLFREERTASVMLLVDNEASAYVAPEPHAEHAVDRAVDAAGRLFTTIENDNHFVGIASLADMDCWLQPGTGTTHRSMARSLLATHPSLQSRPSDREHNPVVARRKLRNRLPPDAQLVVFSPLCRSSIVRFIRRLEAAEYPVTVVSPDATSSRTPSQRLAQVGRQVHVTDLRRDGIPVVDWAWDESLAAALARFAEHQEGVQ